ncbi:uncharacterized protein LOC127264444 [Andrographis paniculata]|uniref:uncharacterized protein LOC127264444 n=1 Tax=Andrographis paniculata TaxID=175694 RepID=UPI0021E7FD73|nr:uncharacterized protein LOC127264444 [Andrographis paniculata]
MSSDSPPSTPGGTFYLHPRREAFEHGLLPISKLIFNDGTQTLSNLKPALLSSSTCDRRVNADALSGVLQIPIEHSRLVIETISSVLHDDSDPLVNDKDKEMDEIGVNVFDLLLFLCIQSYKRLLPRGHKDSAAIGDVWPSTSAFDGLLSSLPPSQLANSRRFMPSQADEEAHQLSYLQKQLSTMVSLLSDSTDAEGDDDQSLVVSMDAFEHLGFLMYCGEKGSERIPLSQNTPFSTNTDPDKPAVWVPASQVLEWLTQNISSALEHISDRVSSKENAAAASPDQDVATEPPSSLRGPSFIEGISKSYCVKQASDLKGTSVKVVNCHESVIYILAPLKYATVYGCSDATIVLGAVGKAVRFEHCERVHLITAAKRICIANCRECLFFLGVNHRPLIVGDNHKLQVAPYNTFYSQLEEHMSQAGVDPHINRWDEPVALGVVDHHDSLSHPAGMSDVQAETAARLHPDQFTNFVVRTLFGLAIPNWSGSEEAGSTKDNPFSLPDAYRAALEENSTRLNGVKQIMREVSLEEPRKRELSASLHACFKDWLYGDALTLNATYLIIIIIFGVDNYPLVLAS